MIIKYPTIKYYVYNRLIDYYLYLLYFAYYNNFNCNYVTNYTDKTLIDEIIKNYNNINKNQQTCLYNKLLFKYNNLFCYTSHRIIIINKILWLSLASNQPARLSKSGQLKKFLKSSNLKRSRARQ